MSTHREASQRTHSCTSFEPGHRTPRLTSAFLVRYYGLPHAHRDHPSPHSITIGGFYSRRPFIQKAQTSFPSFGIWPASFLGPSSCYYGRAVTPFCYPCEPLYLSSCPTATSVLIEARSQGQPEVLLRLGRHLRGQGVDPVSDACGH